MEIFGIYEAVPSQWLPRGARFPKVRWVNQERGKEWKSRLVAKEFKSLEP